MIAKQPIAVAVLALAAAVRGYPLVLLMPDTAILRSGEKNTVFLALEGGRFEPRTVVLGPQAENDTYQVLSGLNEGERIVTSGQFLLDSESRMKAASSGGVLKNLKAMAQKDPVCGIFVSAGSSVKKSIDGKVIHFCSAACRDKFRQA